MTYQAMWFARFLKPRTFALVMGKQECMPSTRTCALALLQTWARNPFPEREAPRGHARYRIVTTNSR